MIERIRNWIRQETYEFWSNQVAKSHCEMHPLNHPACLSCNPSASRHLWCGYSGPYEYLHRHNTHATTEFHEKDGSYQEVETCVEFKTYRRKNVVENPEFVTSHQQP